MPLINKEIDRRTKQEVVWAEGVVEFVKLDKFEEPKVSYIKVPGVPDKKIESTHRASILVKEKGAKREDEGVWIGLGDIKLHPEHENLQVKSQEEWITIERGVEITIELKESEYQGKTYYNSSKGKIVVLSTAGVGKDTGKSAKAAPNKTDGETFDNTGILVGHAVGGAASLAEKGIKGDLVELAKIFHNATTKVKNIIAEATGQKPNSRNLGNAVGNAVNSAVKLISAKETDVEGFLVSKGESIYMEVNLPLTEWIKTEGKSPKVKKEPKETPKEVVKEEPALDFDDEIPF